MATGNKININSLSKIVELVFGADSVDCTFQFFDEATNETKEYSAHQKVLSAISPVFDTMFGDNWNKNADPIVIKDATYDAFVAFIKCFYESEMTLTTDNVAEMLRLADKYDVTKMVEGCEKFMMEHLSVKNALEYFAIGQRFSCAKLIARCQRLFRVKPDGIMESATFSQCEMETLTEFLRAIPDYSQVEKVFDACIKWAEAKCHQKGVDESIDNIRSELGQCFGLIPFKKMDLEAFVKRYERFKTMFIKDESDDIFIHLNKQVCNRYHFEPRDEWKRKFTGIEENRNATLRESIRFKITKHLLLHTFTASKRYSCQEDDEAIDFSASIIVTKNDREIFNHETTFSKDNLRFSIPIKLAIDPGIVYEIEISEDDNVADYYTHKRQKLRDVVFIPIKHKSNVESTEGPYCSIESIEFLDFPK